MDPVPLSEADRAILALECDTVAGHICKVVVCSGAIEFDGLRGRIEKGLAEAPLLMSCLGEADGAPAWVASEEFELDQHVRMAGEPIPRSAVPAEVARLFEQHLDRTRPLWAIDVLTLQGGGSVLVWRIHHSLADGTASMRYARLLLWDRQEPEPAAPPRQRHHQHAPDDIRRRHHLSGFVRREFAESAGSSPFDGRIGRRREIAFASAELGPLHEAAKALGGATINDAGLAVVAGALGQWIEATHGSVSAVRVKVPVSLHHEGDDAGNRDSFFSLAVPLNEPDPIKRLAAIRAATAERKAEHDAETIDSLVRGLSRCSPRLEAFAERAFRNPRRFAVNVSNVPGPRRPVSLLGAPVDELHSIAEIGRRHGLRVSVVSLCDSLQFGFCADPGIVEGVETMAAAVASEAQALVDAAPA